MTVSSEPTIATLIFTVIWKNEGIIHEEHSFSDDVHLRRDMFPTDLRDKLLECQISDAITHTLNTDAILPGSLNRIRTLSLRHWQPPVIGGVQVPLFSGRFYPQDFLHDVSGIDSQTLRPMRIIAVNKDNFTVDLSHPMAGKTIDIIIHVKDIRPPRKEHDDRCSDIILDILDNGPGMQGCRAGSPIMFDQDKAFQRVDEKDDAGFYGGPRLTSHIDSQAAEHLTSITGKMIKPGASVLDLMASVDSHLPRNLDIKVTGLGMNKEEMAANRDLSGFCVHDLNAVPHLPYPDAAFDAVFCNLSIEYLTRPDVIMGEIARVLKPSGILLVSFSNRWFPPKVTRLWTELHEFERLGYITQLCRPHFKNIQTYSYRNWPRPADDRHFPAIRTSDPLYVVTGTLQS